MSSNTRAMLVFLVAIAAVASCTQLGDSSGGGGGGVVEGFQLDKTEHMVFHRGTVARFKDGSLIDALRCEGKHCAHVAMPASVTCTNKFQKDADGLSWQCTASEPLSGGYLFEQFDIGCEPLDESRGFYYVDSCRLVYTLRHPNVLIDEHKHPVVDELTGGAPSVLTKVTEFIQLSAYISVLVAVVVWLKSGRKTRTE